MRESADRSEGVPEADYRGFPLRRVTWGYREQFRHLLDSLFANGLLNEASRSPQQVCAPFLEEATQTGYDYVLKEFLTALDTGAGWLVRVPELFQDWRALGAEFAAERVYMGKRYFQLWGEGHFPEQPAEVRRILQWAADLMETDAELAFSFLDGYPEVRKRLGLDEMSDFIHNGLEVFRRSRDSGLKYFRMQLKSAEAAAERLGRTARLERMRDRMGRLFRAIAGRGVEFDSLSKLDSDELIERGSTVVCGCDQVYLPERVSVYGTRGLNRSYYLLTAVLAAACYRYASFCRVHGREARRISDVCAGLGGTGACSLLFQAVEIHRLRSALEKRYPGAGRMMRRLAAEESRAREPDSPGGRLLTLCAGANGHEPVEPAVEGLLEWVRRVAEEADDFESVLRHIRDEPPAEIPGDGGWLRARPLSFFPDFDYPLEEHAPPADKVVLDLSSEGDARTPDAEGKTPATQERQAEGEGGEADEESSEEEEGEGSGGPRAVYLYDEWNGLENEYYRDWCSLQEVRPEPRGPGRTEDEQLRRRVERVKRLFQRLRPDQVVKEKYLEHGDNIDIDSLVRFVTMRKAKASPRVQFWTKPRLSRRDVAVALLLDVSGSTGRDTGQKDAIEVEKEAACILATGLEELGDRFSVYGFTGNGREQCVFQVFKDFGDDWGPRAQARLMGARPGSSTRIGVALRHGGHKLAGVPAKTRLIILLSDGRPMDTEYDPQTRYAHYDVRKACEENRALGIHTFCIAVDLEAQDELDIMFPRRRYVILRDIHDLPEALTRSYLKLTRV